MYMHVQPCTLNLMRTINVSVARQTLPAQLDRVAAGEEIAITRHGNVIAILVRPDILRIRRATPAADLADDIAARLAAARAQPSPRAAIGADRAEELVAAVRAERSAR